MFSTHRVRERQKIHFQHHSVSFYSNKALAQKQSAVNNNHVTFVRKRFVRVERDRMMLIVHLLSLSYTASPSIRMLPLDYISMAMISKVEAAILPHKKMYWPSWRLPYSRSWRTQFENMALPYVADDYFKCPRPTKLPR